MSTLHKVKAYFGMAPMDDYEDEYYEDDDRARRAVVHAVPAKTASTTTAYAPAATTTDRLAATTTSRRPSYRGGYGDEDRFAPRATPASTTGPLRGSARCAAPPAARWRWIRAGWRAVRGGQPAVEDHHAAAQGLQRGPHHR